MKNITQYIKESIDEENLEWKIKVFFKKNRKEYNQFVHLVDKCKEGNAITKEFVEELVKDTDINVKQFVDFMDDDIYKDTTIQKDYIYLFMKIVELVIGNKNIEL